MEMFFAYLLNRPAEIITIISLILTIISIGIAIFIAYRQKIQLAESKTITNKTLIIGEETKSITEKLATDYFVQERANKLFPPHKKKKDSKGIYKLYYPVKYEERPMPLIASSCSKFPSNADQARV